MKNDPDVVILGGGLAGLSAAYHLRKLKPVLIERDIEIGGTARSFKVNGFTFDITGHLLHLHTPYTKRLISRLLKNNVFHCTRKAFIYSNKTYTRYPFQANTHGLPKTVVDDCVLGFIRAFFKSQGCRPDYSKLNFEEWCHAIFGEGISKHFMLPYNEKLFQTKAHDMTAEWCGSFVPTPSMEEVIKGALEDQEKNFGYNTQFLYPKKGGIQALAQALGKGLPNLYMGEEVAHVDWKDKLVVLKSGLSFRYENLINTIPLLGLLTLMSPLPSSIQTARKKLKHVGILCLNIGVQRSKISDKSWIYFPENRYPFYRVGFPMNFTPHAVPRGCSSMYVELPLRGVTGLSKARICKDVRRGLEDCGILRSEDRLSVVQFLPIRYAYVIYDENRTRALKNIFDFLATRSIQSIGRYGAWKYSFMEEAILDGKKAAEKILNKRS